MDAGGCGVGSGDGLAGGFGGNGVWGGGKVGGVGVEGVKKYLTLFGYEYSPGSIIFILSSSCTAYTSKDLNGKNVFGFI